MAFDYGELVLLIADAASSHVVGYNHFVCLCKSLPWYTRHTRSQKLLPLPYLFRFEMTVTTSCSSLRPVSGLCRYLVVAE